mmetsp:Transcript_12255/g.40039  ORF Transcript_12255/g.40039 Transcript_12255/m.40039 type:complete len:499 (-) Transcript_12255:273-1769(-)
MPRRRRKPAELEEIVRVLRQCETLREQVEVEDEVSKGAQATALKALKDAGVIVAGGGAAGEVSKATVHRWIRDHAGLVVDRKTKMAWNTARCLKPLPAVVRPRDLLLLDGGATSSVATVAYVLRLGCAPSTTAFESVHVLDFDGTTVDDKAMDDLLRLLAKYRQIFAVTFVGDRCSLWKFVEAITQHENGVVFAFADATKGSVADDFFVDALKAAMKQNRLHLEETQRMPPWRSPDVLERIQACEADHGVALGRTFLGGARLVWPPQATVVDDDDDDDDVSAANGALAVVEKNDCRWAAVDESPAATDVVTENENENVTDRSWDDDAEKKVLDAKKNAVDALDDDATDDEATPSCLEDELEAIQAELERTSSERDDARRALKDERRSAGDRASAAEAAADARNSASRKLDEELEAIKAELERTSSELERTSSELDDARRALKDERRSAADAAAVARVSAASRDAEDSSGDVDEPFEKYYTLDVPISPFLPRSPLSLLP